MNTYIKIKQDLPVFLPYPKFLIKSELNLTAREIYALMLHRATISQLNGWTDSKGNIYIVYPVEELAHDTEQSARTVGRALKSLEEADLIDRKRVSFNSANRIFLKIPPVQK